MDMRSLVLIAILTVSGAGLSGCIDAPGFLSTDGETTALQSKDAADKAAAAWSADAKLVSAMSLELTNSSDARIPSDPEVGNGEALAWWYVYCIETENGMDVRTYRVMGGEAVEEKDAAAIASQAPMDEMMPIQDWMIDSDAAIAAAKTDERFRLAAQGFNATVVQGVARHTDVSEYTAEAEYEEAPRGDGGEATEARSSMDASTVWWIVAGSADGIVVALVDAKTGDLVEVQDLDFGFAMPDLDFTSTGPETFAPEPIHLEDAAELDGEAEYPFEVVAPMTGTMDFTASGDSLHSARWWIVDEDGEAVASSGRGWFMGGSDEEPSVDIEVPGTYTLVIGESSTVPFAPLPTQGAVSYEFVLHLDPMGAEEEEDGS